MRRPLFGRSRLKKRFQRRAHHRISEETMGEQWSHDGAHAKIPMFRFIVGASQSRSVSFAQSLCRAEVKKRAFRSKRRMDEAAIH